MVKTIFTHSEILRQKTRKRWLGLLSFCLLFFMGQMSFAQTVTIGSGTSTSNGSEADPVECYYNYTHAQIVYLASELTAGGMNPWDVITGLGFSISQAPGSTTLSNYTISMGHTSATIANPMINSGLSIVRTPFTYTPTVQTAGNFDMINFTTDFIWNGTDNIVVDICTGSNAYISPYGGLRYTAASAGAMRSLRQDGSSSCGTYTSGSGSNTNSSYRPNIQFSYVEGTPPACPAPTSLTATNITSAGADLGWTAGNSETAWNIEWGVQGFTQGSGTTITGTSDNPYSLSGLSAVTSYSFYVQADCGGELSTWAGPYTFTTPCAAEMAPTTMQTFDTFTSSTQPACWSEATGTLSASTTLSGTTSSWLLKDNGFANANSSNKGPSINLYSTKNDWIISNPIDLGETAGEYQLRYKYAVTSYNGTASVASLGTHRVRVVVSTDGGATWSDTNVIKTYTGAGSYSNTGENEMIPLNYSGVVKIAFVATTTSTSPDIDFHIDDFIIEEVPSCMPPSGLTVTGITSSSADLGWTSDGEQFDIKWGETGFDVETEGTLEEGFANGGTLSGLDSNTAYQFYVRQNCGNDDLSPWAGPFGFTTLCEAVSALNENFDSTTTPNLPGCWGKIVDNGASIYATITTTTTNSSSPNGVSLYNSDSSSSSNIILVSPVLSNLDAGTHWLRFSGRNSTASQDIVIGTLSDPTDGSTFTPFETVDLTTTFAEYTVDFSAYSGTDTYIGFRRLSTSTYTYVYLDDIVWEEKPSCMFPLDLTATNLTSNSADLGWTSDGDTFDILWGETGFDVETEGALEEDFANGGTLSGLNPQTTYQFYVRNNCGGDLSDWAGPFGFTTLCAPEAAPTAVQSFSDFSADAPNPVCWSEAKGAVTENVVLSGTTGKWNGGSFGNTGSDTAARVNLYGTNSGDWLISQQIDLGSTPGTFRVKYDMAVTAYTGTAAQSTLGTHIVRVIVSTDGGATWSVDNTIRTYTGAGSYSNTGQSETINLEAYSGVVKIAFVATTSSTSPDVYFFIDNFLVEEIPSCLEPSGLLATNITYESADLGWTSDGEQFDIKWGTPGFDVEEEGTLAEDFENGGTLSGLAPQTTYHFYVRNNCGVDDLSAWAGPVSFTTPCLPTTVPYLQDFESVTVPALPSCSALENLNVGGNSWVTSSTSSYGFTGKSLRYNWHGSIAANVWFYTQGVELEAGVDYVISYDYGGGSASYTEKMKVAYGTSPAHTAMTTQLADHPNINQGTKQYNEVVFSPVATGVYYFGFHAYSAANMLSFHLDNIRITTKGWTGEVNTAWENSANWRGGVPDASADVVIDSANPAVISTDITVNSITLGTDASLTVASNASLTTGDITVANGGTMTVKSGATLWQDANTVNTGNVTIQRNVTLQHLDYTIWSSPVVGQALQAFSPNTLPNRIRDYVANTWVAVPNVNANFTPGKGYMFRAPNVFDPEFYPNAYTWTGSFTGVPQTADEVVVPFTVAANHQSVGNPYPTAIDADLFYAENDAAFANNSSADVLGAMYIWMTDRSDIAATGGDAWALYNPITGGTNPGGGAPHNGIIPAGQGFLLRTRHSIAQLPSVKFTTDMRIAATGTFYRNASPERHRLWLNLANQETVLNQTLVAYVEGATQGFDASIDAEALSNNGTALYSLVDNNTNSFMIQGRALPFNDLDIVPMGFRAANAGTYTISLANFDGVFADGQDIFLVDALNQVTHNLKEANYTFVSEAGEFNSRFSVVYRQDALSVTNPDLNNNWVVYPKNGQFQIETLGFEMKQVIVYDMLGRTVYQSKADGNNHLVDAINANQVLIVKVVTTDNVVLTKKVNN